MDTSLPIGVFDSGVGGISVLKEAVRLLPGENFIYYGDIKNSPYGPKSLLEVRSLTLKAMADLTSWGVKALVVACNTATSAAIDDIRRRYPGLLVLGIEPALKPAAKAIEDGLIVVMATERTLSEEKFARLLDATAKQRNVLKMPCPGLMDLVEAGKSQEPETKDYLRDKFQNIPEDLQGVVLGCTHYPFVRDALVEVIGPKVKIFDGAEGIARNLKIQLEKLQLLNETGKAGEIRFYFSGNQERALKLSQELLAQ